MPLGPGRPAHTGAGLRDMVILRINDDLDLLAGVGMGGAADEFFGDLSVEDGQGRFVGSTGSPRFEGLNNPGTGQTAVSGTFDLDSLATTARLHPTPDGNDQFILQRHAQAAARRTPDNEQDVLPPALLGYGTASDAQLRPTSIVMDLDTNAIYSSEDNTTARVLLADAAGGAHYAFLGPMHGFGVCSQEAGGRVTCIRNEALPDPGASLFMNGIGKNTSGQIAFVGSAGNTVNPTPGAVQAGFGGVRDGFVIDTLQPFLLGLANAAFHGDLGPGDLATAFGAKIGPRKDSYAASPIVNNALQMEVEGVEVLIQREDDSQITAPLLNASYGQTAFELPTSLRPGERIGVQVRGGNLVSNMYWLTLREPGISPFLFNDNEAVVQNGATSAIVTESNPLKPGEFAVLWANSGIPRTPACAGPGSVADPTGNPLHRLVNPEARTVRLQAVTAARETLFDDRAAFEGSPPGQLCNSVLQVNFALADAARWSEASVQAALTASAALRNSDPARFREILAQDPWLPILDPVTGAVLPVFVLLD
jgi:uncharacterized protein (TIGR03437 family)